MRKFEKVERVKDIEFNLPKRSTKYSGGYDFYAIENIKLEPNKINFIKTGVKPKMESDEVLLLFNRSSNPIKKNIILSSGVNVIDADFYNNIENEGEISVIAQITCNECVHIKKGEKICQGVFMKYLLTEDDDSKEERTSGIGSTGK